MGAVTLESIRQNGWICGVPSGVETPGLMQGLAGIGYGLLRLADPQRTPSVLAVEPPIMRDSHTALTASTVQRAHAGLENLALLTES